MRVSDHWLMKGEESDYSALQQISMNCCLIYQPYVGINNLFHATMLTNNVISDIAGCAIEISQMLML